MGSCKVIKTADCVMSKPWYHDGNEPDQSLASSTSLGCDCQSLGSESLACCGVKLARSNGLPMVRER